jgi:hypothetical protein
MEIIRSAVIKIIRLTGIDFIRSAKMEIIRSTGIIEITRPTGMGII